MTRLPESLPAYLQKYLGISRSTFQRWCTRGDVPGAYRSRGGHWRVRKHTKAMLKSSILAPCKGRTKTRREKVRDAIILYPLYPDESLLAELRSECSPSGIAEAKLTMAAHGITDADFFDNKLKERDPEKYHYLWKTSPPVRHPRAHEAVKERPMQTAGAMLRHNGRLVTPVALARALGVSISTLYRRYGQRAVRVACEEPINLPPPSRPRS